MTPYQIRQIELKRMDGVILKDKDLGVKSDAFVAAKYMSSALYASYITPSFVCRVRQKHKIPTARNKASDELLVRMLADPDLGVMPDHELAKKHNTTKGIVNGLRVREGIEHNRGHKTGKELLQRKQRVKVIISDWRNVLLQTWKPKTNWEKFRQWAKGYWGFRR